MLTQLNIQHFILIDQLNLSFDKGLNVFTGETGAGKSILLDALSLVLGARSETRFVRKGSNQAVISATFHLSKNHPIHAILEEQGLLSEEDLILRRTLTADGKSKAFINDQPIGLALLKTVGEFLVEIHGQFATHSLLNPITHRTTLDTYGNLESALKSTQKTWQTWQKKKHERQELEETLNHQAQDEAYLQESVDELRKLSPKIGEEEFLSKRRVTLMNAEKLGETLKTIQSLTDDEEQGILTLISKTRHALEQAEKYEAESIHPLLEITEQTQSTLEELSSNINHLLSKLGDENELTQIDDRLFDLRDVARKHHVTLDELPELTQKLQKELDQITHGEDKKAELMRQEEEARLAYMEEAQSLTKMRKKTAEKLEKTVMTELPALKLEKAQFKVEIVPLPEATENGLDKVTFLLSTNKGSDLIPLHKCASGGELARFMLALKVNLKDSNGLTLIFDEIDAGISGATASAVGKRLAELGEAHQTLVITHSPQVAGYGKHHYKVSKKETLDSTVTSVTKLSKSERIEEVARLLSGASITDAARNTAKELLINS